MMSEDSRAENYLRHLGAKFRYVNGIDISAFTKGWETRNAGRPVPVREKAVEEYMSRTENGSPMPAPIIWKGPNGYEILDGVQRMVVASIMNMTQINGYLVITDSEDLLEKIRMTANPALQGYNEDPEWTRRQAVERLVIQRHMSAEEVARICGWKASYVRDLAEILDFSFKIRCLGGPNLADNMVRAISTRVTIKEMEAARKPIAEFFNIVAKSKFSAADAEPFLDEFFSPTSNGKHQHGEYIKRLESFKENEEVVVRLTGRKKHRMPIDVRLAREDDECYHRAQGDGDQGESASLHG